MQPKKDRIQSSQNLPCIFWNALTLPSPERPEILNSLFLIYADQTVKLCFSLSLCFELFYFRLICVSFGKILAKKIQWTTE